MASADVMNTGNVAYTARRDKNCASPSVRNMSTKKSPQQRWLQRYIICVGSGRGEGARCGDGEAGTAAERAARKT